MIGAAGKLLLKNDVFRVVGRRVGVWAWGMLESVTAILLPYLIAGSLAGYVEPAAPNTAPNTAPNAAPNAAPNTFSIQEKFRSFLKRVTDYRPLRWVKRLYQGVDGLIAGTLSFIDSGFNSLNNVPGFKLLTGFPLYLGCWEYKYKQFKNFIVLRAIWDRVAQPQLKKYVFAPYAKMASIYMAPYADAALRYADKALSHFLGQNYRGGEDFSLASLQESCASGWKDSNVLWRFINIPMCGGGAETQQDEMHQVFSGFSLSTAGIEKLAENNLESLGNLSNYVVSGFNAINQNALQGVDMVGHYGAQGINSVLNVWNGLYSQENFSERFKAIWSQYAQPALQTTWNFAGDNTRYVLDEAWKSLLKQTPEAYRPYAKPVAIATTVVAAGTCAFLGYKWARHKWNQAPTPAINVNLRGNLNVAQQPLPAAPGGPSANGAPNSVVVAQRVAALNATP